MPNNFRAHQTTCLIILICKECKNKVINPPKRQIRQFVVTMACICTLFRLVSVAENIFQMYSTELFQKISISFHFLLLYNCCFLEIVSDQQQKVGCLNKVAIRLY